MTPSLFWTFLEKYTVFPSTVNVAFRSSSGVEMIPSRSSFGSLIGLSEAYGCRADWAKITHGIRRNKNMSIRIRPPFMSGDYGKRTQKDTDEEHWGCFFCTGSVHCNHHHECAGASCNHFGSFSRSTIPNEAFHLLRAGSRTNPGDSLSFHIGSRRRPAQVHVART